MKTKRLITAGLMTAALTACSGNSGSGTDASQTTAGSQSAVADFTHTQSADGTIKVDQQIYTPSQIEAERTAYQRTNLIQLPVDARFNANVLRITDATINEYANKAFIAPRLYSYGSQSGGKLVPVKNSDGSVTLAFNVVFLDGTKKSISRPDQGSNNFDLPQDFLIADPDGLKANLQSEFGADAALVPLPGCPKKLTLSIPGQDYDVTPPEYTRADYCQLNTPVMVALKVPEADARNIMSKYLPESLVDIRGTYETKVSIPVSKVDIHFDRSKIFSDLQASLSVNAWMTDIDAKYASTKVAQNQLMKVVIQGQTSDLQNKLIEQITSEFFEVWRPDPATGGAKPCPPTAVACLRLSSTQQTQSSTMDFSWSQESNMMSGQIWETSAKLKSTPKTVQIGDTNCHNQELAADGGRGIFNVGSCKRIMNDGSQAETGLTVNDGDQIKIDPSYLVEKLMTIIDPFPRRSDNNVCVREVQFNGWMASAFAGQHICAAQENHYADVWDYSTPAVSALNINNPTGQLDQMYTGLAFKFVWNDHITGKEVSAECALAVFPREGDGNTLKVTVQNVPTCKPFSGLANETPMLFLVNHISTTQKYTTGTKARYWDGHVTDTTEVHDYHPDIDFAGSLTIEGYSLDSSPGSSSL